MCSSNDDAARARVKAPFADRFFRPCCFPVPAPPSRLPSLREVAWVHHLLHWNNNVRELSVQKTQSHVERSTAPFPRRRYWYAATNNCDVGTHLLLHVRATITTPGLIKAVARNNLLLPRSLFCEAITVPPKRGGCDCLGTHVRPN